MSKKILLADDSLTIQKVVELTFMDEGYEVEAVGSGEEALFRFDKSSPDLVIADVHMPDPSGYDVCREVKRRKPDTPVLLLVGTFQPFDQDEAEECGADGFIKKPFDSQELFRRVEELVAEAGEGDADGTEVAPLVGEETTSSPEAPDPVETLTGFQFEKVASAATSVGDAAVEPGAGETPPDSGESVAVAAEPATLSDEDVDRIARRVAEILGDGVLREVTWEVVPDLAEIVIKDRLRELEGQLD